MEKLSKKFYNEIQSGVDDYIVAYMPDDFDMDFSYRNSCGDGSGTTEIEIELPDGYLAEVTLRVYTQTCQSRGDYFTPPESSGSHSWEVTNLQIFDKDGELAEEINDPTYMEGKYEW